MNYGNQPEDHKNCVSRKIVETQKRFCDTLTYPVLHAVATLKTNSMYFYVKWGRRELGLFKACVSKEGSLFDKFSISLKYPIGKFLFFLELAWCLSLS